MESFEQATFKAAFSRLVSPLLPSLPPPTRLQAIYDADLSLQGHWRARQSARMQAVQEQYRADAEADASRMDSAGADRRMDALEKQISRLPTPARLDSLYVSATGLGGPNDAQATTQVNAQNPLLTPWTLQTMYQQDGLCTRICNIPPSLAILQAGWFVQDPTQNPDPMREEDERLDLQFNAYCADLFARIYGGGYLLIVADEIVPPKSMREPLRLDNIKRIISLVPMTTLECTALEPTTDPADPNFGEPDAWACVPYPYLEGSAGIIYHHSRVLRFPAVTLPNRDRARNRGADQSCLQAALDALIAHGILNQSVGNLAQRMHSPVFTMPDLPEMLASDQSKEVEARAAFMAQLRGVYGMNVITEGEKLEIVSAAPSGWDQLTSAAMTTVASKVGIPRPILFEPEGGFSKGDAQRDELQALGRQHWAHAVCPPLRRLYRYLYAQQEGPIARRKRASSVSLYQSITRDRWTPTAIARLVRDPVPLTPVRVETAFTIARNPGAPIPPRILIPVYSVVPRPLHTEDAKEQAERRKIISELDQAYKDMGVLTADEIARNRFGPRGWQDEIQPIAAPPTDDGLPTVPDLSLQGIVADVVRGGNPMDAQDLLNEEFPFLDAYTPAIVAAAATLRKQAAGAMAAPAALPVTDSAPLPAITLEYQQGEIRRGISDDGEPWESVPLPCGYGYLEGVEGLDGDEADVLQAGDWSGTTYVIEHRFPDGSLDEYKCVIGAKTPGEALNLYSLTYGPAANYGKVYPVADVDLVGWLEAHLDEDPGPERTDAVPARYEHINFTPPVSVADEARRGLEWRREHGRGGTGVGVARARDLSNRATISPQTVRRMNRYFSRHQGDKKGKGYTPGPGFPSAGRVAWALWGGDPGRSWAAKLVRQMNAADKNA